MGKDLKGKELAKGIRQRKDGRYEARTTINGISINICKSNYKACLLEFTEAKKKAMQNIDIHVCDMTLNEWFEEWFEKYKKPHMKVTSIYPMKRKFTSTFGKKIGEMKVSDIKNIDIQSVVNELIAEGKATSSIRDAVGRMRDCMEAAKNNRLIQINPCFDISVPKQQKKDVNRRFLTNEEQTKFLKHVDEKNDWYREMYYIMFLTGMRVGEIGGLKWDDVDFENKCINIKRALSCQYENGKKKMQFTEPKTSNSYRKIPFMGEAEQMFLAQKEKQQHQKKVLGDRWRECDEFNHLVFTSSMGSPVTRYIAEKQINRVVNTINEEENINSVLENRKPILMESVYPHAIRHTFCSRCFEKGMNPKVVQELMGHEYYSTTIDIYTHVTGKVIDEEIKKFGNIM